VLGNLKRLSSTHLVTARVENGFVRVKVPIGVSDAVFAEQLKLETGATVQPNYLYRLQGTLNDPLFAEQSSLLQIDAPSAWFSQILVPDNLIAVLDTGIQVNHADLSGRVNLGKDFCPVFTTACEGEDTDPKELSASQGGGHGTFATGIIAANTNNRTGISGITQGGKILVVKVFGADNIGAIADTVSLAKGIRYAVQQGAKVLSLSLGVCTSQQSEFDTPDLITENAIGYAVGQGALLVAASGNNGNNGSQCGSDTSVQFPGSHPSVLAVGSVNSSNIRSSFSATGNALDLVAPGEGLLSLGLNNNLERKSGTSFAAPQVAAVAGLMFAKNPTLTGVAVQQILENTALDLGSTGKDPGYGVGLLQAGAALNSATEESEPVTSVVLYAYRLRDLTSADCTVISVFNPNCYENSSAKSGMEIVSVRGSSGLVAYNINRSKDGNALQAGTYRVMACVNQNSNALLCDTGDLGTESVLNVQFNGSSLANINLTLQRI
jgi:subtilisin family serine protease